MLCCVEIICFQELKQESITVHKKAFQTSTYCAKFLVKQYDIYFIYIKAALWSVDLSVNSNCGSVSLARSSERLQPLFPLAERGLEAERNSSLTLHLQRTGLLLLWPLFSHHVFRLPTESQG